MKKIVLFFVLFSLLSPCNAQSEWDKMWQDIIKSFSEGSFNTDSYKLGGLGDLDGWINDFLGGITGGGKEFKDGGVFASGGIFDITGGGILNTLFGDSFGFDEIHNDGSLNNNVTWGIVHSSRVIHPRIIERQKKIMSLQDSINLSVKRLYELEKLTVDYLSNKQSQAVEIENYLYLANMIDDIGTIYRVNNQLIDKNPNLEYVKERQNMVVVTKAARILPKMANFALIDGNQNLLNNEDRNAIINYVIDELRDLRNILSNTYRILLVASNDELYKKLIGGGK